MIASDLVIVAAYVLVSLILTSKGVIAPFLAVLICCIYGNSSLFDASTAVQAHLFYVITYLIIILLSFDERIRASNPAKLSMFMMVILNVVMAWDAHNYANIQTWHYLNYATNTTLIHLAIICTLFAGRKRILRDNLLYVGLRRMLADTATVSSTGQLPSSGNSKRNQIKKAKR